MRKTLIIAITLLAWASAAYGQADRRQLRQGNRNYNKEKYDRAEVDYRRALGGDTTDFRGQYNLANSLYRQGKYGEASQHYMQALGSQQTDKHQRARTYHNMGNSLFNMSQENGEQGMQYLQQAIKAYQESLKLEPKNEDTRYNLAYARKMLQQMQQQGAGGQQQNNGQQDDKQQQQQGQQQQDQQSGDQHQNQQEQQANQPESREQQMQQSHSREDAERMLEAVKNNERQTLKEQVRKEQTAKVRHTDKDW